MRLALLALALVAALGGCTSPQVAREVWEGSYQTSIVISVRYEVTRQGSAVTGNYFERPISGGDWRLVGRLSGTLEGSSASVAVTYLDTTLYASGLLAATYSGTGLSGSYTVTTPGGQTSRPYPAQLAVR